MRTQLKLICSALALASCASPPYDERQITNDESFGFAFPATVVEVLFVKADIEPRDRFTPVGAAAAALIAEDVYAGRPLTEFTTALAATVGGAVVGETEEFIRSTRCMYFIEPDERQTFDIVQTEILVQQSETFRDFLAEVGDDVERIQGLSRLDLTTAWPVLTLPQSCDQEITPGKKVVMTFSLSGGTIHLLTEEFARIIAATAGKS